GTGVDCSHGARDGRSGSLRSRPAVSRPHPTNGFITLKARVLRTIIGTLTPRVQDGAVLNVSRHPPSGALVALARARVRADRLSRTAGATPGSPRTTRSSHAPRGRAGLRRSTGRRRGSPRSTG